MPFYDNFTFEADVVLTLDLVLDKFDQFCKLWVCVFVARHQFLTMKQNTIDAFLTVPRS